MTIEEMRGYASELEKERNGPGKAITVQAKALLAVQNVIWSAATEICERLEGLTEAVNRSGPQKPGA